jgi:hypothetical protein
VGVTWATKIVHSFYYRVEKKRWVKVNWILESRQRCGVPVTGDWDSDLPLKQQQTLLTLEDDGLFNMPNLRTRKTYYEDDYPGFTWRKGHSLDEVVLRQIGKMDWAERQQWLNTLEAATAPASIMLDAAPEGSWEAFYTLSREWEGSLGELIHAASAL